ncbi:hypothetical protein AKJ09_08748 [Labilithrix luteola]|uniref:Uncharacterized protein n=1 Tax=Labilithrix luteola TaxID=1391654 RepID=A0A0K1Q9J0_9BACT|nr:hypothetical protein AKJ09_08748 [Labilithrix luteola]
MTFDEELGELTMSKNAVVARRGSKPREAGKTWKDVCRIEGAGQRPFDFLAQPPRFTACLHARR